MANAARAKGKKKSRPNASGKKPNFKIGAKKPNGRNGGRGGTSNVLAQGVGTIAKRPFGSNGVGDWISGLDALSPKHLALPRAVGPYTVIRATKAITTTHGFIVFGSWRNRTSVDTGWCTTCAVSSVTAVLPINNAANSYRWGLPISPETSGTVSMMQGVPSALTVQVINGEALQSTAGIVYVGRSKSQYRLEGCTRTYYELGQEFISYQAPRLCSAGKLALRGVTVNAGPLNMNALSDFAPITETGDMAFTYAAASDLQCEGFQPLVVVNPAAINLTYLVTMEWRVRFDPSHQAAATHRYYEPASQAAWNAATRFATTGHGVKDIAISTSAQG